MNKKEILCTIILWISLVASCFAITLWEINIIEADNTITSWIDLENTDINEAIPFNIIYQIYNKFCEDSDIISAEKSSATIKKLRAKNISYDNYLSTTESRFYTLKNLILDTHTKNEKIFCQNKYILYNLLEFTQILYSQYTEQIKAISSEDITEESNNSTDSTITLINNASELTADEQQFVILANDYIQREISQLVDQHFLNDEDLAILNNHITINYIKSCANTKWEFHMLQSKNWSAKEFKFIELNINICNTKSFMNNFEHYVNQIFIHEIAHYIFAFKDDFTEDFTNICRESEDNCSTDDFVSTYAKKNYAEDYADTFAYRYLDNFNWIDKEQWSAQTKLLWEKIIYFNGLAQRMLE